jgi:glycosyltransferase involved in cell wall biosynthesis
MVMNNQYRVLLPTDVFPPHSGGSGWSTHALARALQDRGHIVTVIVPRRGNPGLRRDTVGQVPVVEVGYTAPRIPFIANIYRFEMLWPLLRNVVVAEAYREEKLPVVIHGQHAQTIPAAVLAAQELGPNRPTPVLATVRDAWPWHYFATGLLGEQLPFERRNSWTAWLDLIGRLGPVKGTLAVPTIPYLQQHVERRAELLAQADAVIACSGYIQRKLQPIVPRERLHVIPHLIDIPAVQQTANQPSLLTPNEPFVLFVGKLERNKGAHLLPEVMSRARDAGATLPLLLIAGNGELQSEIVSGLTERGIRHQLLGGWTDHDEVLRLMLRAEALIYPSAWGEPLSRVLLEASAVGACIIAMNTGGTSDIIVDGQSGVLVSDAAELGQTLATLLSDTQRRRELGATAKRVAGERFAANVVVRQVEQLYQALHEKTRNHTNAQKK